jgi:hypothetical protein
MLFFLVFFIASDMIHKVHDYAAKSAGYTLPEGTGHPSTGQQCKPVPAHAWSFCDDHLDDQEPSWRHRHQGYMLQAVQEPWQPAPMPSHLDEGCADEGWSSEDCFQCCQGGLQALGRCADMGHGLQVAVLELAEVSFECCNYLSSLRYFTNSKTASGLLVILIRLLSMPIGNVHACTSL